MKHLKLFENYSESERIESICKKYGITNYSVNSDGSIDVDGDVRLQNGKLQKLPLKFGRVTGHFSCQSNKLTTLEGAPNYVGGYFSCQSTKITTLEGGPIEVGGGFYCFGNKLAYLVLLYF